MFQGTQSLIPSIEGLQSTGMLAQQMFDVTQLEKVDAWIETLGFGDFGPWLSAALILFVGFIVCWIIQKIVEGILHHTELDEKIADALGVSNANTERAFGTFLFWFLMLFVVMAAISAAELGENVTRPLENMLAEVTTFLPRLLGAGLLAFVAFAVATIVKKILVGILTATRIDERLGLGPDRPLTTAITTIVFFLIILTILQGAIETLGIQSISEAINPMIQTILSYVPILFGGAVVLALGIFLASIVNKALGSTLAAAGIDRIPMRLGYDQEIRFLGRPLSEMIAKIVALTIIVVMVKQSINIMNLVELKVVADKILDVWGGIVIFLVGVFVAGMAKKAITNQVWRDVAYYGILVFVGGMALQAANLTTLSDTTIQYLMQGAIIAAVLAFGIGGGIAIGLGGRYKVQKYLEDKQPQRYD